MATLVHPEQDFLNWGRLTLDGIPYADLSEAAERGSKTTWLEFWLAKADSYEALADEALVQGHTISAGEWLWLSSLCCQYGQFLWSDERTRDAQARKAMLYARAAPYLRPPAERIDLPYKDVVIPGYLRLPLGRQDKVPCVVLLGGLESTKEESYLFENLLLARGVATFAFDGPGQGEMWEQLEVQPDFDRYTSFVADYLGTRAELDPGNLGVLGRSLGGHYALRSASADARFRACVSWGGFVYMDRWEARSDATRERWRYVTKAATQAEAREKTERIIDCRTLLPDLRAPTYILHGALDPIPIRQVDVLRSLAIHAPLTIEIKPAGDHCCHNLGPAPRVAMADWIADRLR